MLQIRRVLQLLEAGVSQRNIALELKVSRNTVKDYVLKFIRSQKSYSDLLKLPEYELGRLCYNPAHSTRDEERYNVLSEKIPYFLSELNRTGVTRYLLWQEYCARVNNPYSYQQFCEHVNTFKKVRQAVMHLEHKPGERAEIDFAGKMLSYVDKESGEVIYCPVLVAVLPYSGYSYVEALPRASMELLVAALNRCMQHFGGVPVNVISDNMKQVVSTSNRYEPSFSELADQWSLHYNTSLFATRVRKPRDKSTVEKAVDLAYMRIYAPLRDEIFFSLAELNHHIKIQLDAHNHALMQKKDHSRYDLLLAERSYMKALPEKDFEMKYTVKAKVQKNYHITLGQDWHHYSVPFRYIGKEVKVVYDTGTVEVYLNLDRIAFHTRSYKKHGYSTLESHMPDNHYKYKISKGWNEDYFLEKATIIGDNTSKVIQRIIGSRQFTEQAYNACLGILRLKEKYGSDRLEAACKRALSGYMVNYKTISNILSSGMDKCHQEELQLTIPPHENIRGASSF